MNLKEIIKTAKTLVADDKGLLAIDESNPTCNKRFAAAGIPQTGEFRRSYREMIIITPGLGECISGVGHQVFEESGCCCESFCCSLDQRRGSCEYGENSRHAHDSSTANLIKRYVRDKKLSFKP